MSVLVHYCALSLPLSPSIFAHLLLLFFFLSVLDITRANCVHGKQSVPRDHLCVLLTSGSVETNNDSGERDSVLRLLAEEYGTEQILPDLLPVFL